jgi:ribose transport system ATP-binding protein
VGTRGRISGLRKVFGDTVALDDVSVEFAPGEIHALVGANGSGKSTLIKILAGVESADSGTLEIDGETKDLSHFSAASARACGLHFVHQESSTFDDLTVAENFALVCGFPVGPLGRIRSRALRRLTQDALASLGVEVAPDAVLESLRPSDQTMVAIARAIHDQSYGSNGGILVLDEPTATLPPGEVDALLKAIRKGAASGLSIVFVSHRLDEVLDVADRVTALRDGKRIATVNRDRLDHDSLVELIVGKSLRAQSSGARDSTARDEFLVVDALVGGVVKDVSLTVRRGELVGLIGLAGSGCSTLLRLIFGAQSPESGVITLGGEELTGGSPYRAMEKGVALVPPDRANLALFPEHSVEENMTIASVSKYWDKVALNRRRERSEAAADIERYSVLTSSPATPISHLSGGNQQKVIFARWLRRAPKLLLLDEPTQGVDVSARADLWLSVRKAISAGMAGLVASSDIEELAEVCHRVLLIRGGEIAGEAAGQPLTADRLTQLLHLGAET